MKAILIAYDGSECSDAKISELTRAGLPSKLQAHVVSVAEVWTAPVDPAALAVLPAMVPAEPAAWSEEALATRNASELTQLNWHDLPAEEVAARLESEPAAGLAGRKSRRGCGSLGRIR